MRHDPIFIVGRFRSGTTMFWNLLRRSDRYTGYYEPCHEHLLDHLSQAGARIDPSHTDVVDYWHEYRSLMSDELRRLWRPWFGRDRFHLGPDAQAEDLARFLRFLCDSAPRRPVLKLVRCDFRVGWLRNVFPRATVIHVVRDPRSLWTSSVGRSSGRNDRNVTPHPRWGRFVAYGEEMAKDLGIAVAGHPYRLFYAIWRLSNESIAPYADEVWKYEDAVIDFGLWGERHLVDPGLLPSVPKIAVRDDALGFQFHNADWYADQEREVDQLLREQADGGRGPVSAFISDRSPSTLR